MACDWSESHAKLMKSVYVSRCVHACSKVLLWLWKLNTCIQEDLLYSEIRLVLLPASDGSIALYYALD